VLSLEHKKKIVKFNLRSEF